MISIIIIFSASNDSNNTKHNECNGTMIIMFINSSVKTEIIIISILSSLALL